MEYALCDVKFSVKAQKPVGNYADTMNNERDKMKEIFFSYCIIRRNHSSYKKIKHRNGKIIKCMEKVNFLGRMVENILVNM